MFPDSEWIRGAAFTPLPQLWEHSGCLLFGALESVGSGLGGHGWPDRANGTSSAFPGALVSWLVALPSLISSLAM